MQSIAPCLWFDDKAEEAAELYVSLFPRSRIVDISRWGEGSPRPADLALMVVFEIDGLEVQALNGGPEYTLSPAFSLSVKAPTQEEIDRLWDGLLADGGVPSMCGWLTDRYGVSWQIVPPVLEELLADPDKELAGRVMQAMLGMTKLDIAALQAAAAADDDGGAEPTA